IQLGDVFAALDRLASNGTQLDDETRVTLQLAAYARQNVRPPLQQLVDQLLGPKLSLPVVKILAAQLIRYPDQALLDQLYARYRADKLPFNTESAGTVLALLCATGVNRDWPKFAELRASIAQQSGASPTFLAAVEAFFRGQTNTTRITAILPILPLPIEINYALIDRYPGTSAPVMKRQP
ncbi:MAG: hypothetical protein ABI222_17110, partial [Opitutaceae bacterium]